jgi:ParB-like nuclease family protein
VLDKQLAALAKNAGHDGIVFHGHDDLNPVQYIAVDPKAITNAEKIGQYSWSSLKVEPEEAETTGADRGHEELQAITKNAGYSIPTREIFPNDVGLKPMDIHEAVKKAYPDSTSRYGTDHQTEKEVDLNKLQGIQKTIESQAIYDNLNKLKRGDLTTDLTDEGGENGALVVRVDGKDYVVDGNHRLAALKLAGEKTAKVHFVDTDGEQPVTEDAGMKRLVDKLNAKDWWHVRPEQGAAAYAHRGKFMSSQVSDFYGPQLKEPQKVNIKNPIVGTEPEIAEKLGLPTQYDGMPYEEMKKLDREWAIAAKKAGYDAIVTVGRAALDKFMAGGRIPRNMEIQDLTHVDESLPTPKAQAHPDPIGIHEDDLPARAKYADVDFDKPDLQDTAKRVTADSIRKDYVREKDRNKVSVYKSYIPMEDLPTPKFVSKAEANFERQDYQPRVGSPIKVDIHPNGSVNILDGNHRVTVWDEQGQQYAPAWVIDHRHPGIEMLSEDEKAEREED